MKNISQKYNSLRDEYSLIKLKAEQRKISHKEAKRALKLKREMNFISKQLNKDK